MKTFFFGFIIGMILVGGLSIWYFKTHPEIVYKWKDQTSETTYKPQPAGMDWHKIADLPLAISGSQQTKDPRLFDVFASDGYKAAHRTLSVDITCPDIHWILIPMISGGVEWDNTLRKLTNGYGGQFVVGYSWGPIGIAGAPGFLKFPTRLIFIGSAGISFKF